MLRSSRGTRKDLARTPEAWGGNATIGVATIQGHSRQFRALQPGKSQWLDLLRAATIGAPIISTFKAFLAGRRETRTGN